MAVKPNAPTVRMDEVGAPQEAVPQPAGGVQDLLSTDGRQSPAAAAIGRGVRRLLAAHGLTTLSEFPLPNGRRADILGLDDKGVVWIVEIKSSVEDFRSDRKWPEYRDFCDHLLFAVAADFPHDILPPDTGLIIADRFGGELVRPPPLHALNSSRRRGLLLRIARAAMARNHRHDDPELAFELFVRK